MSSMLNKGKIITSLYYPGFIGLKNETIYFITYNRKLYAFFIKRKIRAVKVTDLENSINYQKEKNKFYIENDLMKIENNFSADENKQSDGSFMYDVLNTGAYDNKGVKKYHQTYYTEIGIAYESDNFKEKELDIMQVFGALNCFIFNYKAVSRDYALPSFDNAFKDGLLLCLMHSFIQYEEKDIRDNTIVDRLSVNYKSLEIHQTNFLMSKEKYNVEKTDLEIEKIHKRFMLYVNGTDSNLSKSMEVLINCLEQLDVNNNTRLAFIEAIIICEFELKRFLVEEKKKEGKSEIDINNFIENATLGTALGQLKKYITDYNDDVSNILKDLENKKDLRNDIMHYNKNVSKEDCLKCIDSVNKIISIMHIQENNIHIDDTWTGIMLKEQEK